MKAQNAVSRRDFVSGLAVAAGCIGISSLPAWAQTSGIARGNRPGPVAAEGFDSLAKLCFNENPYGPPESVIQAMTQAFKYANRYGYPDGGLVEAVAAHHGVQPDNIVLGAGSTEVLQIIAASFLSGGKQVVGVEPTFGSVYEFATGLKSGALRLPLLPDHRQDVSALLQSAAEHKGKVGFIYVCNPNNPTGVIVTRDEMKKLAAGLPENVILVVDEAYHHFVEHPDYGTSVSLVSEGKPVVVTRTFSKIAGLAGVRLGYGVAPAALAERMRQSAGRMTISALAKWGGVAALKDVAAQKTVREKTIQLRKETTAELVKLGFETIPSETNFFMVNLRRSVLPVIQAFQQRGILVGRPFPPLLDYLRVSVGTADEMSRFVAGFKEIVSGGK